MAFQWDEGNLSHATRHGVTAREAEEVIGNNPVDMERSSRNGEERTLHLGETAAGRIVNVVSTVRDGMIRVVTAYPADKTERTFYLLRKEIRDVKRVEDADLT